VTNVAARPLDATIAAQREASDPRVSAWVKANAGAGKTYVLAQRVLRLLLAGTNPSRLLCITYTKAAASEMANRVFDWLAGWAIADDATLADEIARITGRRPTAAEAERARRLFAEAVETPGGLKIQTIHAFCERLLQQFPFEASVTAGFTVLDDRTAAELLATARGEILMQAATDAQLSAALAVVVARLSDTTLDGLIAEVVSRRSELLDWLHDGGDLGGALDSLGAAIGLPSGTTEAGLIDEILAGRSLPRSEWASVATWMRQGSTRDEHLGDRLAAAAAAVGNAALDDYLAVFLTREGTARRAIVTNALAAAEPELCRRLEAERDRVARLAPQLSAARLLEFNRALFTIADAILQRYQSIKSLRGLLDFDDLIERTAMLLTRTDAAWVLYKLDGGIDHILVDEAQDTSPRQWEIIDRIAGEFFAGEGARQADRTVFAVGDIKQSIYSFQGAEPARFAAMRKHFERAAREVGKPFRGVTLRLSFRSTPAILKAVDEVFRTGPAAAGVVLEVDREEVIHTAVRERDPGLVEIWPVIEPEPVEPVTPWDAPLDVERAESPAARLASRIARTIRGWIDREERLEATGLPIRPGDVMILLARRKPFAELMIRALKAHGIPVAGADRMVLTDHIAVMDLVAVGRFALMPEDDLTLAALLKSPLIGLGEDDLMALAAGRRGSLWQALVEKAETDAALAPIRDLLADWRARVGFQRPYDFYAGLLGAGRGRAAFHARLGAEAFEALDEFLGLALAYERAETPSLPGFLAWLEAAPTEIKRDMDKGRDEVRVMTVHGAKGLEAPVVFLPDCARAASGRSVGPLFRFGEDPGGPLVFAPSKAEDCAATATLREAAERARAAEENRLLYVAMTRARDRLYIAGFRNGTRRTSEPTWHDIVSSALDPLLVDADTPDGPVRRLVGEGEAAPVARQTGSGTGQEPLPAWLRELAAAEAATGPALAPSRLAGHAPGFRAATDPAGAAAARRRGTVIHRLLESLPEIAVPDRAAAAARALQVLAPDWTQQDREEIAARVLAILADPVFAPVFAPGGLAEATIAGPGGPNGERVLGQVDRLLVCADEVLIVDYKTDRLVPDGPDGVPQAYRGQLDAYRRLAARIWPGKTVRTALLWTSAPRLMQIG
jgi:ATP-dependent helicase/nuclease subunit A